MHIMTVGATDFVDRVRGFIITSTGTVPGDLRGTGRICRVGRLDISPLVPERIATGLAVSARPDRAGPWPLTQGTEIVITATSRSAGVGPPL